ncbi:hypothetical protein [Planctomicrobium sp. SH664]
MTIGRHVRGKQFEPPRSSALARRAASSDTPEKRGQALSKLLTTRSDG